MDVALSTAAEAAAKDDFAQGRRDAFVERYMLLVWFCVLTVSQTMLRLLARKLRLSDQIAATLVAILLAGCGSLLHQSSVFAYESEVVLWATGQLLVDSLWPPKSELGIVQQTSSLTRQGSGLLAFGVLWKLRRLFVQTPSVTLHRAYGWLVFSGSCLLSLHGLLRSDVGSGERLVCCLLAFEDGDLEAGDCFQQAKQLLIDCRADPNALDPKSQRSCLHIAIQHSHELSMDLVEILLTRGANPSLGRRPSGLTPLMQAGDTAREAQVRKKEDWEEHYFQSVDLLLRFGAHVDQQDVFGDTALALAAERGQREVCQFLVHMGADLSSVNKEGVSVKYWFKRRQWDVDGL
eukprot:TRINITY_DN14225_c0_g5_i1.p1 TRINITY_DN14225_c0_g5~~TRINITY_DN14225_c0_g5_i1.p1  ORF type:complete len:349 (-),score=89.68 TRINITY_DN14225_c0_g5_i1:224-1270(-)